MFTQNKEINSVILKISDFEEIFKILEKIIEKDNIDTREQCFLNLNIQSVGGGGLKTKFVNEFLEYLSINKKLQIRSLEVSYYGNNNTFLISYLEDQNILIRFESKNSGASLQAVNDIEKIFSNSGWNSFFHSNLLKIIFPSFFMLAMLPFLKNLSLVLFDNFHLLVIGLFVFVTISIIILMFLQYLYPCFVIMVDKEGQNGRILKEDIIWIIAVLIGSFFVPGMVAMIFGK